MNSLRDQWIRVLVDGLSAERITWWAYFHKPSFETRVTSVMAEKANLM